MQAEIIAIGSELLTRFRLDTNSLYLTGQLEQLGIPVTRKTVVGDEHSLLCSAIRDALTRVDILILVGGLGPTTDDLTREAAAEALGLSLERNADAEEWLRERFRRFKRHMPESNLKQTEVLQGAEWFRNDNGTAPAQWLATAEGKVVILLPGPPRELEPLFEAHCLPRLRQRAPKRHFATRVLKIAGMGESAVEEIASRIYTRYENPRTTILSSPGLVEIHLLAEAPDSSRALQLADTVSEQLEKALAENVFARGSESLEQVVGLYLTMRGGTLAVAESCTGGLLAQRLTEVPGSSRYFAGGVVTYSNEAKMKLLKVPATLLKKHGAVSAEVAAAMAAGARKVFGSRYAIAITGIAGPDGGTPDKPVGTVFIALDGTRGDKPKKFEFPGDRERVRWVATQTALDLLRRRLLK